uniref:Uncharacterized protein n=1 Tax=Anguilla anguilla TaxID=7936 RepID=A0A0E9WXM8_ANGAN
MKCIIQDAGYIVLHCLLVLYQEFYKMCLMTRHLYRKKIVEKITSQSLNLVSLADRSIQTSCTN